MYLVVFSLCSIFSNCMCRQIDLSGPPYVSATYLGPDRFNLMNYIVRNNCYIVQGSTERPPKKRPKLVNPAETSLRPSIEVFQQNSSRVNRVNPLT